VCELEIGNGFAVAKARAMAKIERTVQQLVVQSGSTTLALDRQSGKATMRRKLLFWARAPIERPLTDIVSVNVNADVDRASGVELCSPMLVMRDGSAWALPHTDRADATETVSSIRSFLGITA
jgi:hypothetical protein